MSTTRSRIACYACRRGKRRCDRVFPSCQLCIRKDMRCSYPKPPVKRSYTPEIVWDDEPLSNDSSFSDYYQPVQLDQTPNSGSTFDTATAVQFLAPRIFRDIKLETPRLEIPVPNDVTTHVGDFQQIRDIAAVLFSNNASWLPIVCRKHFFSSLLNPLTPRQADGSLLALCVKLYCTTSNPRSGSPKTALYKTAKKYHSEIEMEGIMSLQSLQATIFIALYEIGQAIYPAAYLTVGTCARYGIALGLDQLMTNNNGFDGSWMEIEERRRSWWAVLALDRFLNFGDPSRRLATDDPEISYYLPVDDQAFIEGNTTASDAIPISAAFHLKTGSFARLAQATYLISEALRLATSAELSEDDGMACLAADTAQLRRTLEAQVNAAEQEHTARRLSFCCQTMFSYCGIFLLQDQHWQRLQINSKGESENHTFPETRRALDVLGRSSLVLRKDFENGKPLEEGLPIFFMQTIYQAAMLAMDLGQDNPDKEIQEKIESFRWLLQHLQSRWKVAKIYLDILGAKKAFHDFNSISTAA
ncbi:hypothetical protein V8C35DRAFT_297890 [Trichoderma chlorosporum]